MTLRVTLEIVPFGVEENKRTIHTIDISNQGRVDGSTDQCSYGVVLDGVPMANTFLHYRSDGAIFLAEKVLKAITLLESIFGRVPERAGDE